VKKNYALGCEKKNSKKNFKKNHTLYRNIRPRLANFFAIRYH
jgi:hypothetical protein